MYNKIPIILLNNVGKSYLDVIMTIFILFFSNDK